MYCTIRGMLVFEINSSVNGSDDLLNESLVLSVFVDDRSGDYFIRLLSSLAGW